MRTLLAILLLLGSASAQMMQVVATSKPPSASGSPAITYLANLASTNACTNTTNCDTGAFTPVMGDLLVVFIQAGTSVANPIVTDSIGENTFVQVVTNPTPLLYSSGNTIYAYIATAACTSATSRTIHTNFTADATAGTIIQVLSVSNMHVFGLTAVVQAVGQSLQSAAGTPAPVFSPAAQTADPVLGFLANAGQANNLDTAPTGWSEGIEVFFATPNSHMESVFRNSGETGTTITWGAASATAFGDIIMELSSALGALATPTASPVGGYYASNQTVTIDFQGADYGCYTIDTAGGTPSDPVGTPSSCSTGTHYTTGLTAVVAGPTTIKAKGYKTNYLASPVLTTAAYTNVVSTAPQLVSYTETTWGTTGYVNTNDKATGTVTWQTGDILVVIAGAEGADHTITTPTATGLTFTPVAGKFYNPGNDSSHCGTLLATATAAGNGSSAVTTTFNAGSAFGFGVWVFRSSTGVGNASEQHTGTKTVALTPVAADGAIVWAAFDWGAGASPVASPTATDSRQAGLVGSNYGTVVADITDQTSAGSVSYGLSGGSASGPFSIVALEVKHQ